MHFDMTTYVIGTLLMLILFIGIAHWAWSSSAKNRFDESKRYPFDDDELDRQSLDQASLNQASGQQTMEKHHD